MKYDDASWHYNGTFPADSPKEYFCRKIMTNQEEKH